jgi:hypothetical protein
VKIFCIGLSRTGTSSMCEALSVLGIKTIHYPLPLFVEYMEKKIAGNDKFESLSRKEVKILNQEIDVLKKNKSYNKILNNYYEGFGDLPIPIIYKDLDKIYPGSKFIYTRRNEEKWLNSMKWMYSEGKYLWNWGIIDEFLIQCTYHTRVFDTNKLMHTYINHEKDVLEYFKNRSGDFLYLDIDKEKVDYKALSDFL